jgi:hypothetical protein
MRAGDRPHALKLSHLAAPLRAPHARQQPRLASPRPTPLLAPDRPACHADRIAASPDGMFAKLNAVAVWFLLRYYPDPASPPPRGK